jgi:hypothetical protein
MDSAKNNKIELSLCLIDAVARHKDVGEWRYSSTNILDLDFRWRWVVSLIPRSLDPRDVNAQGRAPEPVWTPWNREKVLALAENQTLALQLIAYRYTDWTVQDNSPI